MSFWDGQAKLKWHLGQVPTKFHSFKKEKNICGNELSFIVLLGPSATLVLSEDWKTGLRSTWPFHSPWCQSWARRVDRQGRDGLLAVDHLALVALRNFGLERLFHFVVVIVVVVDVADVIVAAAALALNFSIVVDAGSPFGRWRIILKRKTGNIVTLWVLDGPKGPIKAMQNSQPRSQSYKTFTS